MLRRRRKYNIGGTLTSFSNVADAYRFQEDGSRDQGAGFISGAARGAAMGSVLGPVGGVVGGLVGGISTFIGDGKANHQNKLQQRKLMEDEMEIERDRSKTILNSYPVKGTNVTSYANGGKLLLDGGHTLPITGKVDKFVGDSHQQDTDGDGSKGISLRRPGQEPFAEVEGQEVMKDNKLIFSDNLGIAGKTYAAIAQKLAESPKYKRQERIKRKAEDRLNAGGSGIYKSTDTRVIEQPDDLDRLFALQESSKAPPGNEEGVPMGRDGIDLQSITDDIMPYADNLVNAAITSKTPNIPRPRLNKAPVLNTKIDVNDQLAEIKSQGTARNTNLLRNTANSTTARANLIAGTGEDIRTTNSLLGEQSRIETQLENQNIMSEYQNRVGNTALLSEYDRSQMLRQDDIQGRISANAADASTNYMSQRRDDKLDIRDKQALALTLAKYEETGVLERADVIGLLDDATDKTDTNLLDKLIKQIKQMKTSSPASAPVTPVPNVRRSPDYSRFFN